MKQRDCDDDRIRKEISFGVNDPKEKRDADKEKFKDRKYMELQSITFQHRNFEIDFGGICINTPLYNFISKNSVSSIDVSRPQQ